MEKIKLPKIILPKYMADVGAVKVITYDSIKPFEDVQIGRGPIDEPCWVLGWGSPVQGAKNAAFETGFFWDAGHIDTMGLYKQSSLNSYLGWEEIEDFVAPMHCSEVIEQSGLRKSKYNQTNNQINWDGVVLALQNPGDRSVLNVGSTEDYYQFVRDACKYYGKNLFLKLHPWNNGDIAKRLTDYANEFGCSIAKCNHSCLENCKFVLVWNSSFAVDCFVRGIPVAQYAPGYFYQTPAVTYTAYQFPDFVDDTTDYGFDLADFLLWRYCFNIAQPIERWVEMLRSFAYSGELFPLEEEFCYANNTHWSKS